MRRKKSRSSYAVSKALDAVRGKTPLFSLAVFIQAAGRRAARRTYARQLRGQRMQRTEGLSLRVVALAVRVNAILVGAVGAVAREALRALAFAPIILPDETLEYPPSAPRDRAEATHGRIEVDELQVMRRMWPRIAAPAGIDPKRRAGTGPMPTSTPMRRLNFPRSRQQSCRW